MLLGPNGAGKTTALRLITGALPVTAGSVYVFGLNPAEHGGAIRKRCGIVPARPALYDRLSGWDNLRYAAELYEVPSNTQQQVMRAAAERFDIADALDRRAAEYSTGMRARLALARAVLHSPELLLLDEPTAGLDPESSRAVLALIGEYTATGVTVVMNTHLLIEAEGLADHVIVMDEGRSLESGAPDVLRSAYFPNQICTFDATDRSELLRELQTLAPEVEMLPTGANVPVSGPEQTSKLVAALVHSGIELTRVDPHMPSLDELYFEIRRRNAAPSVTAEAG